MTSHIWGDSKTQFFYDLTIDKVLESVESLDLKPTGRVLTLNSMENRVYEIEVDRPESEIKNPSDNFVVAKFYRPGRWSFEQVQEEHQFMFDLLEEDIPVIAPLKFSGESIFKMKKEGIFFCVFPKKGGRNPDEFVDKDLEILGRTLARVHLVGKKRESKHRLKINPLVFGTRNLEVLDEGQYIPHHIKDDYFDVAKKIIKEIGPLFENIPIQRIHGDCHLGNIIRRDETFFLIDFDDMLVGPPVQDTWLFISGDDIEARRQRDIFLNSYEMMNHFDDKTIKLIEPLRALRMIHFSGWIAKRYDDPAFKQAFPQFETDNYWYTQIVDLKKQLEKTSSNPIDSNYFY